MRLPEQRLWDTMKTHKPSQFVLERVENLVTDGMADVYVAAPAVSTWVELKAPSSPKRKGTRVLGDQGLRQSQKNWHLQKSQMGIPTWILIRTLDDHRLWLVPGGEADRINEYNASELDAVSYACNWEQVFAVLEQ